MNRTMIRAGLYLCVALPATALADIPVAAQDCAGDLVETTPSSDFNALDDGSVVRHEPTSLEWKRCPEGLEWTGGDCTDEDLVRTDWQGALMLADQEDDWRMPSLAELRSIVEHCREEPAYNTQVFPEVDLSPVGSTEEFWSSSPYNKGQGEAFPRPQAGVVNFRRGTDDWQGKNSDRGVRLVRDAE